MNCMKCGRETTAEQVFCDECQLEMAKYPVKPGTVVLLPNRKDAGVVRKVSRRRVLSTEEQVKYLRRTVRILASLLLVATLLILLMIYPTMEHLMEKRFKPGQNYTAVTSTTAPTEAEK